MAAPPRQQQELLVLAYPDDLLHSRNIKNDSPMKYHVLRMRQKISFFFFSLEWKIMDCLDISITVVLALKGDRIQRCPISANLWAFFFEDHFCDRECFFRTPMNYEQSAGSCLGLFGFFAGRGFFG